MYIHKVLFHQKKSFEQNYSVILPVFLLSLTDNSFIFPDFIKLGSECFEQKKMACNMKQSYFLKRSVGFL